jgi:hypothetical protein
LSTKRILCNNDCTACEGFCIALTVVNSHHLFPSAPPFYKVAVKVAYVGLTSVTKVEAGFTVVTYAVT